jgi:hypothetical protein
MRNDENNMKLSMGATLRLKVGKQHFSVTNLAEASSVYSDMRDTLNLPKHI